MTSIIKWVQKNRFEFLILLAILAMGSFLRLYRIGEYMVFLGDEGRDAIIVRRLLVDFDPILIGPGTSVGDMYLGPLYYYFIAPGLLLANFSPVGPSVQIALFGVATIALIWFMAREWFGKWAGLIAALLYAVAPTVVLFSLSSWNPNIMPFVALVSVYALWRIWNYSQYKWFLVLGVAYAFVLQSHYLGLILAPPIIIFWVLTLRKEKKRRSLLRFTTYGLLIFGLLMSPLLVFDYRHGWINYNGLKELILGDSTRASSFRANFLPYISSTWDLAATRLVGGRNAIIGSIMGAALAGFGSFLLFSARKLKGSKSRSAFILLFSWLTMGFVGLSFYSNEIYDHYMGFFFPAPFLILGGIAQYLITKAKLRGTWIVATVLIFLVFINLENSHLEYPPNRQLQRTETVANKVVQETGGRPFNLAVIANNNYEDAYLYFLEKWGAEVVKIDSQRWEETVTDQLFVICELENKDKCDPTHNAKAEVANFGWSKIDDQWDVEGIRIYKLSHVEQEE